MTGWLALLDEAVGNLHAPAIEANHGVGWLCGWHSADRPHPSALRVDPRLLDPAGPACRISLVLLADHARPIADDPTALQARRAVLRDGRPAAVSVLTDDPVHLAGAITVARADRPDEVLALRDDPFLRLGPARLLDIGAGLLGSVAITLGPVVERYAGAPWPYDRWKRSLWSAGQSSVGLGDRDDPGGGSAKAPVGGDQGGIQRRRQRDVERVTDRDPVHQRPRGGQEGTKRPATGPERSERLDAVRRPGQLAGSPEASQRREDLDVEMRGRRHVRSGGQDTAIGLGCREIADQIDHDGGVNHDECQRPTSRSSSARAPATSSAPVGPSVCEGPRSRTRCSHSPIEGTATWSDRTSRR